MRKIKYLISLALVFMLVTANAEVKLPNFTTLIEAYSPAVVNISTEQKNKKGFSHKDFDFDDFGKDFPFENIPDIFKHFFDREFNRQNFIPQQEMSSLGSGMIISHDGYIMTNHHVIDKADEIIVRLKDRREFKAKVIGSDQHSDTALLKIDATNLPTVKIGSAKNLKVGEWVFAIGSPFGFDLSASAGIVSAKGRSVPGASEYNYVPFIQTDVAINPGNSGGPLFNLQGEVVGMNSMIYSRSGGYMGVSFSIPIDVAMNVAKQLKSGGKVARGWLGVLIQPVTYDLAKSFGMDKPQGSLVAKVMADSPAQKAGVKVGDVVLKFDGQEITKNSDLPPIVAAVKAGTSAPLEIWREGKHQVIDVVVGELPDDKKTTALSKSPAETKEDEVAGMSLSEVPDKLRKTLKLDTGGVLVKSVADDSSAASSGILPGDVIVKLAYKKVSSVAQLKGLINKIPKGKSVPVYIVRQSGPVFLAYKK